MKKTFVFIAIALFSMGIQAQVINIHKADGTVVYYPANEVTFINFTEQATPDMPGTPPEGVEAVDLELPSGTLWANMNIGATEVMDFGYYFAWGDITGYGGSISDGHCFDWANYRFVRTGEDSENDINKYQVDDNHYNGCWYNNKQKFIGDGDTELDAEDDAATACWGSDWRMPTQEDMVELIENTNSYFTKNNGVGYRVFVSKKNGKSITLPACGFRYGNNIREMHELGDYWTSTLVPNNTIDAYRLNFTTSRLTVNFNSRCMGFSVRAVYQGSTQAEEE